MFLDKPNVSIRSPHRSKGRQVSPEELNQQEEFQSAPLTEARGDKEENEQLRSSIAFQSAPLTEARGDSPSRPAIVLRYGFNPLPSPKQGETDLTGRGLVHLVVSIRSPHRSKGRPCRFARPGHPQETVSIRSPHRSKGRPGSRDKFSHQLVVSIRSPHRSKGRHVIGVAGFVQIKFQSAPLTEARGD